MKWVVCGVWCAWNVERGTWMVDVGASLHT